MSLEIGMKYYFRVKNFSKKFCILQIFLFSHRVLSSSSVQGVFNFCYRVYLTLQYRVYLSFVTGCTYHCFSTKLIPIIPKLIRWALQPALGQRTVGIPLNKSQQPSGEKQCRDASNSGSLQGLVNNKIPDFLKKSGI